MKSVSITIGPVTFDHADYDPQSDVLYLHVGEPQPAESEETRGAMCSLRAPGTSEVVPDGDRRVLQRRVLKLLDALAVPSVFSATTE